MDQGQDEPVEVVAPLPIGPLHRGPNRSHRLIKPARTAIGQGQHRPAPSPRSPSNATACSAARTASDPSIGVDSGEGHQDQRQVAKQDRPLMARPGLHVGRRVQDAADPVPGQAAHPGGIPLRPEQCALCFSTGRRCRSGRTPWTRPNRSRVSAEMTLASAMRPPTSRLFMRWTRATGSPCAEHRRSSRSLEPPGGPCVPRPLMLLAIPVDHRLGIDRDIGDEVVRAEGPGGGRGRPTGQGERLIPVGRVSAALRTRAGPGVKRVSGLDPGRARDRRACRTECPK